MISIDRFAREPVARFLETTIVGRIYRPCFRLYDPTGSDSLALTRTYNWRRIIQQRGGSPGRYTSWPIVASQLCSVPRRISDTELKRVIPHPRAQLPRRVSQTVRKGVQGSRQ